MSECKHCPGWTIRGSHLVGTRLSLDLLLLESIKHTQLLRRASVLSLSTYRNHSIALPPLHKAAKHVYTWYVPIRARHLNKEADRVGESRHVVDNLQLAFFLFFCGPFFVRMNEVGSYVPGTRLPVFFFFFAPASAQTAQIIKKHTQPLRTT